MQLTTMRVGLGLRGMLCLALLGLCSSPGVRGLAQAATLQSSVRLSAQAAQPAFAAPVAHYAQPAYPPPITAAPPSMVWLAQPGVYIALGVPQPIFYLGGAYYYDYAGRWYSGPHYGGPWQPLAGPPPALRGFRAHEWSRYQQRARQHARDPRWRHFHAAPMPHGRGNDGRRGSHPGYRPGRARGGHGGE